jgi:GntR family transcriptional regulator, transcriptional repressor for pyruvate dehydrogenase complex
VLRRRVAETAKGANIADAIFEGLRNQILRGELKAGERLLNERELAVSFGTNRNTLREAVRKLEQARLVTVRHGRGVIVSDFRRTGTLELLAPYLRSGPDMVEVVQIVEDILAPRVLLLEYATRLAVRRAEETDLQRLRELSELLNTAFAARDAKVVASGFQRWLDAVIDAGHSVAVRWIANPFLDALRNTLERLPMLWILEPSFPDHLRGVLSAIEAGDEEKAVAVTRSYYARVDRQLLTLLRTTIRRPRKPAVTEEEPRTPPLDDSATPDLTAPNT